MTQANLTVIDSLKLVHERLCHAGTLPIVGFLRLAEDLRNNSGILDYCIQGDVDRQGRALLKLRVRGTVHLQCQRCLDGFEFAIAIDTVLRLVAAETLEAEQDTDPNEPDCIAASTQFDLAELIEDEVLLALPAYPRHDEGPCGTGHWESADADEPIPSAGAKVTAFSALKALKQKTNQSKE